MTFTPLQFGVYDVVTNFNIGRKASVLIFEELGMIPRKYTLTGSQIKSVNSTKLLTRQNIKIGMEIFLFRCHGK